MKRGRFKVHGVIFTEEGSHRGLYSEHRSRTLAEKAITRYVRMSGGKKTHADFEIEESTATRRANPRSDLGRAQHLYRNFRGRDGKVSRISFKMPRALTVMGYADFIGYTVPGIAPYKHTFSVGARPILCTDGRRLYLLRGRIRVTSRGIVDLDSRGREED